jgi:phosphoribosylglycinamide formyltransferase-1
LNAIDQALKSSVKLLGNTAHFIDEGIDTGPIIMQTVIARDAFRHYDDVLDLQTDMLKTIWELLDQNLIDIENNSVRINGAKTFSNNHYSSI